MAKHSVPGSKMSIAIQGRADNRFTGTGAVSKSITSNGEWQKIELVFSVPVKGKWEKVNNVLLTLGGSGKNCEVLFDDFRIEEK